MCNIGYKAVVEFVVSEEVLVRADQNKIFIQEQFGLDAIKAVGCRAVILSV